MKTIFFVILVSYLAFLGSGSYVSVYYTYFAIPTLVILGILAFGNPKKIHRTAKYTFWFSLILTMITVASVSYLGVYLIYIVLPILILSLIIMTFTAE